MKVYPCTSAFRKLPNARFEIRKMRPQWSPLTIGTLMWKASPCHDVSLRIYASTLNKRYSSVECSLSKMWYECCAVSRPLDSYDIMLGNNVNQANEVWAHASISTINLMVYQLITWCYRCRYDAVQYNMILHTAPSLFVSWRGRLPIALPNVNVCDLFIITLVYITRFLGVLSYAYVHFSIPSTSRIRVAGYLMWSNSEITEYFWMFGRFASTLRLGAKSCSGV